MYRYDTRLLTCFQQLNRLTLLMPVVLLLAFGLSAAELSAQSSATPKNVYVPLTTDTYGDLEVTSSEVCLAFICSDDFDDLDHLTDGDPTSYAEFSYLATLGSTAWIQVTDNNATSGEMYPVGSYAGVAVEAAGLLELAVGEAVRISTYNGNTEVDFVEYSSVVGLLDAITLIGDGTVGKIGFEAPQPFNSIRLTYTTALGVAGAKRVYYAEVLIPDNEVAPDLSKIEMCNLPTPWVQGTLDKSEPGFPVIIETERTGVSGSGIGLDDISGLENVVNSDTDDAASLVGLFGALGRNVDLSVRTLGKALPAGTFAGYSVSMEELLSVDLLGNVTVTTWLAGLEQESASAGALIASVGVLGSSDRYTIGFQTSLPFDEIQISMGGELLGLSLDVFNVYHPVVTNFCPGADLTCLTDTPISTPDYPAFINAVNTGVEGIGACLLGDCITGLDYLLDGYPTTTATIDLILTVGRPATNAKLGAGRYRSSS